MTDGSCILSELLREAAIRLKAADVANGMADARILICAATGLSREELLREPHRKILQAQTAGFHEMIRRRCAREPVSRILGYREFRSLEFALGPDTLDPRADSEAVVETALEYGKRFDEPVRVLDLGTGTGCLLLSILNELPGAEGIGGDIADGATELAAGNAAALGLESRAVFVPTVWTDGVDGTFDIVVSNPPYIEGAEIAELMPEVSCYDPVRALDGGVDGLDAYREIATRLDRVLSPDGVAVFEIGSTQRDSVAAIFAGAGFELVEVRADLSGHPRVLVFRRPST